MRIKDFLKESINIGKENYWRLFSLYWLQILLLIIISITMFIIIGFFLIGPLIMGSSYYVLSLIEGKTPSVKKALSTGFKNGLWWKGVLLFLICIIGIFIGYLLIIPGIYLQVAWSFAFFILLENPNIGILEALKRSRILVHQFGWWRLFILGIITSVLILPLSLPFGWIPQSFITPLIVCLFPYVYKYFTSPTTYI